jgi:hypothetical protein
MNLKSARMRLIAAVALYFVWVGSLVVMAVYSSTRPADRTIRPSPEASPGEVPSRDAQ